MECQVAGRTQYFWYNKAIGASSSIEDMGVFQWHLCLVLGFAWIVLYLFVNRGVQSAGKVSWQFDFWGRKREMEEGARPFSLSPIPFPFLPPATNATEPNDSPMHLAQRLTFPLCFSEHLGRICNCIVPLRGVSYIPWKRCYFKGIHWWHYTHVQTRGKRAFNLAYPEVISFSFCIKLPIQVITCRFCRLCVTSHQLLHCFQKFAVLCLCIFVVVVVSFSELHTVNTIPEYNVAPQTVIDCPFLRPLVQTNFLLFKSSFPDWQVGKFG